MKKSDFVGESVDSLVGNYSPVESGDEFHTRNPDFPRRLFKEMRRNYMNKDDYVEKQSYNSPEKNNNLSGDYNL